MLAEPRHVLALRDAPPLRERREQVLHRKGAQPREEHNAEGDEVSVIGPDAVLFRIGVIVRVAEELARRGSELREEEVGEEDEGEEVEGEAWRGSAVGFRAFGDGSLIRGMGSLASTRLVAMLPPRQLAPPTPPRSKPDGSETGARATHQSGSQQTGSRVTGTRPRLSSAAAAPARRWRSSACTAARSSSRPRSPLSRAPPLPSPPSAAACPPCRRLRPFGLGVRP